MGEIDKETYGMTYEHLTTQMVVIGKELNNGKVIISNQEKMLTDSLKRLENISKI